MHHLTLIQSLDLLFTFPCWKPPILCQPAMPNHGTSSFCMMEAVAATFSCTWPYLNPWAQINGSKNVLAQPSHVFGSSTHVHAPCSVVGISGQHDFMTSWISYLQDKCMQTNTLTHNKNGGQSACKCANVQMLSEGTSSKTATNSMHQLLGPRPTPHQLTQPCSLAVAMDDAPDKYFIHWFKAVSMSEHFHVDH